MQWSDAGVVLAARRHGENSAIVHVLTESHGRHAGLVRGGAGRRARAVVQPGNEVAAAWRARLPAHLGTFVLELARPRAALVLEDAKRLAGLCAAAEVLDAALPEREPHPEAFVRLRTLLDDIEAGDDGWHAAYARWELALLAEIGFGLDVSAAGGPGDWEVSPRTGAVQAFRSGNGALPLPRFLLGEPVPTAARDRAVVLREAFALTGAFLRRALRERRLPARARLLSRISP